MDESPAVELRPDVTHYEQHPSRYAVRTLPFPSLLERDISGWCPFVILLTPLQLPGVGVIGILFAADFLLFAS